MKINPGYIPPQSGRAVTDGSPKPVQQKNFADVMHQQEGQASSEELNRRFKEIQLQGDRLARSMTIRELKSYRQMVKRFLEDTVRRGVKIKETRGFDRRGRTKRYKLLEEIDATLLSMADELLESEEGKIELLQKIGDIRGMLINLLF
ncbi:YaaR family protein [Paenibacillus sediminis]|uniref:Uncharacterized protein YaaR (DUF327 family) n=1 Tax=Paenibacillus sediminis TaxID=664909 RepID=A0ABS4H7A2_9BACL|nr:YaaR family protein [Paenibacillus sediminis]MBP1938420.1 uncharacterized protein YaaR (DUF327 family) [Paenibacillus sediminis]